jgi:light-regulated signal transduction histidine kinase (bacteriophytochrome)
VHTTRSGKQITESSRWALQRDEKGKATGFLEINVDITARKQTERELERYMQELERSNAELQDFAAIASHDLQEPLRKVLAFGDHLREHCGDNLDELGRDFLGRMQNAARRMSVLIEALLQYSRVTTRAQPFQRVDLTQVMFEVLVDMEERIAQTHAKVAIMPLPNVIADPMQMRQLLQNLVANAIKFQRPGTAPHLEIGGRTTDQGWCEISVRDTGIGFDEKYLDRIFRPFQRLHGRSEYEGSGMGLAICRKVVARHGGTITAHSRPGEGSTFVVTLPGAPMTDEGRGAPWKTEAEASWSESCSPKTMMTITT